MRREHNQHLAVVGDVVRIRRQAGLACERHAAEPAESKVLAPPILQELDELAGLSVDLVWAHARRHERVGVRVAALGEDIPNDAIHRDAAERAGEVVEHRLLGARVNDAHPGELLELHASNTQTSTRDTMSAG